jgi:hypothetical protein
MSDDTYPIIAFIGKSAKTHAAWSLNPQDFAYETFCGLKLRNYDHAPAAPGEPVTCKRCRRSLGSRTDYNDKAWRTLRVRTEAAR